MQAGSAPVIRTGVSPRPLASDSAGDGGSGAGGGGVKDIEGVRDTTSRQWGHHFVPDGGQALLVERGESAGKRLASGQRDITAADEERTNGRQGSRTA